VTTRFVHRGAEGERGAFIILWAILLVALMTMVAIVIDLGDARSTRRSDQAIADFAALAAGDNILANPRTACTDAWNYVVANATGLPSGASSPCGSVPTSCDPTLTTTPPTNYPATNTSPYTITFRFPVSDTDIANTRYTSAKDGAPCQRFRVSVARTRASFFAGVVGEFQRTTSASAVMLALPGGGGQIPSLWLIDPQGCTTLDASGGAVVNVGKSTSPVVAGLITVDSDGQGSGCSSTKQTMDASGSGTRIAAIPSSGTPSGEIDLFSMPIGSSSCQQSQCDQGDVSSGRVSPQPQHGDRATRAPVDYAFNCKAGGVAVSGYPIGVALAPPISTASPASPYPNFHPNLPSFPGVPIPNCSVASVVPPYIDTLTSWPTKGIGSTAGIAPLNGTWTRWSTLYSCTPSGTTNVSNQNVWIDCGASGLKLGTGNTVNITNGNVVVDGGITLTGSGTFNMSSNLAPTTAACIGTRNADDSGWTTAPALDGTCLNYVDSNQALMYIRSGDLNPNGGTFSLTHTAVVMTGGGILKATGGSPVSWSAPATGPFDKLTYWDETPGVYTLNGGGSLTLSGAFFTPEASPFKLVGGGGSSLLAAQFISLQLEISGGGTLNLVPQASANLQKLKGTPSLIR
jgi:hypothetical protein